MVTIGYPAVAAKMIGYLIGYLVDRAQRGEGGKGVV